MTEAYRYAEASTVAPFEYSSLILSLIIGYLVFSDVPTIHMIVGGIIVVGVRHIHRLARAPARFAAGQGHESLAATVICGAT